MLNIICSLYDVIIRIHINFFFFTYHTTFQTVRVSRWKLYGYLSSASSFFPFFYGFSFNEKKERKKNEFNSNLFITLILKEEKKEMGWRGRGSYEAINMNTSFQRNSSTKSVFGKVLLKFFKLVSSTIINIPLEDARQCNYSCVSRKC